jgi:uncharacterized membrane protein YhaH (DUF805 family)
MDSYLAVLRKYATFDGRARRREYWVFTLINTLVIFGLAFVNTRLFGQSEYGFGLLNGVYALAVFLPSFAVTVRRLHDTGRSGWWLLIGIIPLLGGLILLVFQCQDSEPGDNRFGANPKLADD